MNSGSSQSPKAIANITSPSGKACGYASYWSARVLAKVHALLAHSRFVCAQIPAVNQIVVRMDWRGLHDRTLCWDAETVVFGGKVTEDRSFGQSHSHGPNCVNSYFSALRRAMLPLFAMFDFPGQPDAATWLTQNLAQDELRRIDDGMRLFEP